MKLSTISLTTLVAAANALDTSNPFVLKVHKPGSDIDGTRLSILEDDMYLANEGGMYLFTLSNNGSIMTQYGPGIEFDHDDEVETSSKGRKITSGLKFNDDDILQIPGNDMGLIACPVTGKEAEYAVKSGGQCQNGISFEAKAENDDKAPGWPKSNDNSDVDTSKQFGLIPEADGEDFNDMALVMLDGEMWLSYVGDAVYTLDNGVLKTSYGKGIEFNHDDQVETSSSKATSGVKVENGELKVPGNDMGFRLCPKEGKVAPYEVKSGGNCPNGKNVSVKVAPLDNDRDAAAVANNESKSSDSASSTSGASSSASSGASTSGASSSGSSASATSGSSSRVTGAASTMAASATGSKNADSSAAADSSPSADNASSAGLNVVSAGAVAVAFAALLKCQTSTPPPLLASEPPAQGFGNNNGCDNLSDYCNLFDAPSLTVSPDSVFSKSECSSSNLDYSYDFDAKSTAGDAIFQGPMEDPQDWSPLFEAPAETPATTPPLMIRTFHSTERRSAIVVNNKVSKPTSKKSPSQPPIVVADASDSSAIRRARNTEAARRSRAKKNEKIQELEALVAELMNQNESLQAELRVYRRLSE
ncbi:hypothetical protein CJU89_1688 [Yarrowia sp. B02]|nr:hypothetical protein CJU89_1688 [Yarrowia sp. B02]